MPRTVGVIAEYNPFHRGHAHHLAQARAASHADYVVAVMSTCFTQRGEAALLSPADRARMALSCGADAVVALPAVWAVRDAEHFALGGVALLKALGCDAISFGTETMDISLLQQAAGLLENPPLALQQEVRQRMAVGLPHPAALAEAADSFLPGAGRLLGNPNSTLAICYLRAMLRLNASMEICPIRRESSYHATSLGEGFPSATALRGAILRGDWFSAQATMPDGAFRVLQRAAQNSSIHRPTALDTALLYRLRTMTPAEWAALPDVSEGIEHRLRAAADAVCTREDLLQTAKTRRYPYARLSRLATHALLGFTQQMLAELPLPDAAWLIGYRQEAKPLLSLLASRTRLLTRSGDLQESEPWFAAESRAYDLWSLGIGLPAGLARTQGISVI